MNVTIYTDGACSGNPGIGGWGVVILTKNEKPIYLNGGKSNTTNNQMELMAAIKALSYLDNSANITLFTDSKYIKDGIETWIINWKKNGWKTASKKPVKNQDLWQLLDEATQAHSIQWQWVKGHSGHRENELADQLANRGIDEL